MHQGGPWNGSNFGSTNPFEVQTPPDRDELIRIAAKTLALFAVMTLEGLFVNYMARRDRKRSS